VKETGRDIGGETKFLNTMPSSPSDLPKPSVSQTYLKVIQLAKELRKYSFPTEWI
jgi:hypothetical protein